MDVGNKEKLEGEKRNEDSVSYRTPQLPSDCRFGGMGMVTDGDPMAACNSMADSYGAVVWDHCGNSQLQAVVWDHCGNSQPYSSLNEIGLAEGISDSLRIRPDAGWQEPNSVAKGGFLLPTGSGNIPHISQLPADSAFIERAARFSCFNSGNIADLMNSFPMNQTVVSPYHQLSSMPRGPVEGFVGGEPQKNETNPPSTSKGEGSPLLKKARRCAETKQTESDEAESVGGRGQQENSLMDTGSEPSLPKGVGPKKRRRAGGQDT